MWVKVCFVYSVAVVYLLLCLYFFYNFQVMLYSFLYSVILRLSSIISRSTQWMRNRTRVKSRSNPDRLGPLSTSCKNSKTWARPPSVRGQTSQSCVRNFWSKINGLWFLCGWNGCWCSFGSCVCLGLIDNLYDFFWRHALRTFMCGSLRLLFFIQYVLFIKILLHTEIWLFL